MMQIKNVILQNFRCFGLQKFQLYPITYICGENGCGKTSILEAIYLINGQNSFRCKTLEALPHNKTGTFYTLVESTQGNVCVSYKEGKKELTLDEEKVSSAVLKKMFTPILFAPQHELSLASSSTTRNFYDKLTTYTSPQHERLLHSCKELLAERLKILFTSGNNAWLSSIEEQISQKFTIITYNRFVTCQKINNFLNKTLPNTSVTLANQWVKFFENKETFSYIEQQIQKTLENSRNNDKLQNKNSITTSNITFNIFLEGVDIEICSSGQQKLMGSLLTLAVAYTLKKLGKNIVLLLDDITAKMDENKQQFLHNEIAKLGCQTVISCIEKPKHSNNVIFLKSQGL